MKLWITVEFDTEAESLIKGGSREEVIAFIKRECEDESFRGIMRLIKIEDAPQGERESCTGLMTPLCLLQMGIRNGT